MKKCFALFMTFALLICGFQTAKAENGQVKANINAALNVEGGTLEFVNDSEYPWTIDSAGTRYAAKSGNTGYGDTVSILSTTVELKAGDVISFSYKVSSEEMNDYLYFKINGKLRMSASGVVDWTGKTISIDSDGTYTLEWSYFKSFLTDSHSDAAWVDDVFAGSERELTGIYIEPASGVIAVGQEKLLQIVPVPIEATVPDVKWSSDDEAVIKVSSAGVATGISVGIATVTATCGELTATARIRVENDTLAYGFVTFSDGIVAEGGYNRIGLVSKEAECLKAFDDGSVFAAEYFDGNVYGYYVTESEEVFYFIMDFETHELSKMDAELVMYDMSYDYSTKTMYGMTDNSVGASAIFTIDLVTGEATQTCELSGIADYALTFACNKDGKCYTIDSAGTLFSFSVDTGVCVRIGKTGVTPEYVQSMAFDHNSNVLYWAEYSLTDSIFYKGNIRSVNIRNANTTVIVENTGELCGMFFEYNSENETVPGDVTGDGRLNTGDAVKVLRYVAGIIEFNDIEMLAGDVTGDGRVNTGDAVEILRKCTAQ